MCHHRVSESYRKEEEFKNNFRVTEKILNSSDSWYSLPVLGVVLQFECFTCRVLSRVSSSFLTLNLQHLTF